VNYNLSLINQLNQCMCVGAVDLFLEERVRSGLTIGVYSVFPLKVNPTKYSNIYALGPIEQRLFDAYIIQTDPRPYQLFHTSGRTTWFL
jgi:hypothetical protein